MGRAELRPGALEIVDLKIWRSDEQRRRYHRSGRELEAYISDPRLELRPGALEIVDLKIWRSDAQGRKYHRSGRALEA